MSIPSTSTNAPAATPAAGPTADLAVTPGRMGSLGPVGLVLAGGISVQFGGALAVTLMPRVGALGVVTLRLLVAGSSSARGLPTQRAGSLAGGLEHGRRLRHHHGRDERPLLPVAGPHPLGPAVTLEVLGPLALSVLTSRRALNAVWAGLALAGVFLLGGGGFSSLDPAGVAFALGAGAMWATYIIFSARTGRRFPQADGLALAMVVAAVAFLPLGVVESGTKLLNPATVALGSAVAVLSSVLPYTLELLALRRLPPPPSPS